MISLEEPVDVLEPGVRVDHFRVVRMLGRGGAGEVYLARDTKLGRKVALKVIRSETLEDRQARLRFIHEARVTARFNHPHIVTIFAVGEHASTPYVALEYLEGENLAQRLQSERPGVRQALRIALAVAEALEEAHAQGVFHRDLKPQNILIPRDGRVRVVDFGLAKRVEEVTETGSEPPPTDQAEGAGCTRSGTGGAALQEADTLCLGELETHILQPESRVGGIRGTPAYMAPEQWEAKEVGPAADIWALGIILHELLTGVHPYTKDGFRGLRSRVTSDEPAPQLEDPNGEVEDEIKDLVARCLSKRPEERPSANELVRALGGWLNPSALGDDESPYRGLLPFGERHAHLFYGREREVGVFLERLRDETIIPVVGPSGAGKSSFVAAGVVPRLREQGGWTMMVGRSRSTYTKSASRSLNTIVGRVDDVIARTEGCVVSGTGGVFLMDGENAPRVLGPPGGVVGPCFRGRLLVWASGRLTVFDEELEPASVVKTGPGVSAVGCAAGSYLLGYQEGGLDLLDGRSGRQRGLSFHGLPSSSVVRIVAGPPGTVAVGFSNGQAGVWSIDDGARLHHLKVHGSARHLSVRNEGLHVASDLGQYSFLDLKDHYRRRCEVLRSIWQRVPVIWQKGEAHREEPPKHHECAPPAGGKTSRGGQSP